MAEINFEKMAEGFVKSLREKGFFVSRWVPISEGLPEDGKEVLTCSNGGFIEIQSLEDCYGGYWENQKGDWTDLDEIIAWMPLPEGYKAEGSDKK